MGETLHRDKHLHQHGEVIEGMLVEEGCVHEQKW